MKIIDCIQGSPEWLLARCGVPTASDFDRILTTTGKLSKSRTGYLHKLAGERIAGKPEETYQNGAMQRGTIMEAEAREFYEITTGETIQKVGFCTGDDGLYGASPDGLIGEDGGIEIKCPMIGTHVSYLVGRGLPTEYYQQVQGGLLITGRKWWDFISYYPGLKPLVVRVVPDAEYQATLEKELVVFCGELDKIVSEIK